MLNRVLAERVNDPLARSAGVGQRLERDEGFGDDDEERLFGVKVERLLSKVAAVNVGDEAEVHPAVAVVRERDRRHLGAKV